MFLQHHLFLFILYNQEKEGKGLRHKNTIFAERVNLFLAMKVYFSGNTNFLLGNIKKNAFLILFILYSFCEKKNGKKETKILYANG